MFNGLIDGDGHRKQNGNISFVQRDEDTSDIAQAIGVILGYATSKVWRSAGTHVIYYSNREFSSFRGSGGYEKKIDTTLYTGTVWCPQLPKGTWVARKNGRSFITGNSYPKALIEPCVLAGCPEARCEACGTPYHRVVYTGNSEHHAPPSWQNPGLSHRKKDSEGWDGYGQFKNTRKWTDEFVPGCNCNVGSNIPEILDPFGGSGTTAIAAAQNKRGCTLLELNPDYCDISIERIKKEATQIQASMNL